MPFTDGDFMYRLRRNRRYTLSSLPYGTEATTSFARICLDGVDFEIVVFACCADFICWWVHCPVTEAQFFHT